MLILKNTKGGPVIAGRYFFFQFETKTTIGPFSTFRQLLAEIKIHRKSNGIPVGTDFEREISAWICAHVAAEVAAEFCVDSESLRAPEYNPGRESPNGFDGSHLWAKLHRYAIFEQPSAQNRDFWLSDFAKSLPCGPCRQSWRKMCAAHPLSKQATPAEFFEWTWHMHDLVSEKIGRARITLEAARERWSK